jgi:hypothetical protein
MALSSGSNDFNRATFSRRAQWRISTVRRGGDVCTDTASARAFTILRTIIALKTRCYEDQDMRIRENRPTIQDSLSTTLEVEGRGQMLQHIFDTLGKKGVVVTDEMVHVTPYGFDDRTGWDEHIIVVERFGVFGFTDGPCLTAAAHAGLPPSKGSGTTADQFSAEVESAYGNNK